MPRIIETDGLPSLGAWDGLSGALFDDLKDIPPLYLPFIVIEFGEDAVDPFVAAFVRSTWPFSQVIFHDKDVIICASVS